ANGIALIRFTVTVDDPLAAGVTIINQSTVGGNPSCADTSDPCEPTSIQTVNLKPIKTVIDADGDGVAEPGEVLTYTLTIRNTGSGTALNIPVTDPITDTDVTYITGS